MTITIPGGLAADDRGTLRYINDVDFSRVKRMYQVENYNRNFIRAWHGHKQENKLAYVPRGAAMFRLISIYNIEKGIYQANDPITLSSAKPEVLFIPYGYAHGFKTLTDDTIVQFFSDATLQESLQDDYRYPYNLIPGWDEDYR